MASGSFDALIDKIGDNPLMLTQLARTIAAKGDTAKAHELARRSLALAPDNAQVRFVATEILSRGVPHWHFTIVRDEARNEAYDAALRRVVRPGMRVLEIGTGTGLLAMMAARAGATEVFTCEMNPAVAESARAVIARNGFADRVKVIGKHSADVDAEKDMGGRADVLVSEIVSNDLLSEAALPAHEQAHRRLLKPSAKIIPAIGRVRVALAYDAEGDKKRMSSRCGFDLSDFNVLASPRYHIGRGEKRLTLCSDTADLFSFDFQSGGPWPEGRSSAVVHADGRPATAIAQWIALDMDGAGQYENTPESGASSCWAIVIYPFVKTLTLPAGTPVTVRGSHDRNHLTIWPEF